MFTSIVSQFVTGAQVPPTTNGRHYIFTRALREAIPECFSKKGTRITFIGNVDDLIANQQEIIEKMKANGYDGPFEERKERAPVLRAKDERNLAKIEEINSLTDEELFDRIQDTFGSLTLLSEAAANLQIRSMIVSGSAGTGKTYEVIKALKSRFSNDRSFYYHQIKGTISPIALYIELYRARNGVLVIDDADEAFTDSESLQILKAATESTKSRTVSYRKLSMALEAEGIPQEFEFEGCVVILTNTNLEESSKNRQGHYEAIISRAHYVNAVLLTDREKIMRIRHIITTTTMLHQFIDPQYHQEVIDFIEEHHARFRELSIRTVVKLAELRKAFPEKWEILARGTLLG